MAKPYREKLKELPPERRRKIKALAAELIEQEYSLRELRRLQKKTQKEVARKLEIGQDSVSRIEKRSDMMVSTLRKYIEAIGGELNISITLPNHAPIKLDTLFDPDEVTASNTSVKKRKIA